MFGADAGRPAELPVVGVAAVERVHVLHFGVDALELVAGLERMRARRPGVVDLRVVDRRVLPLRIRRLAAEVRVAGDELRRQAAGDARIGRAAPAGRTDPERAAAAERRRILARLRPRIAEPHFEQRLGRRRPRRAEHELAVARVDVAVAGAARRQRDVRLIVGRQVAHAVAGEHRRGRRELHVDLDAGLVRVGGELLERGVVVGGARDVACRAAPPAPCARSRSSGSPCPPDR